MASIDRLVDLLSELDDATAAVGDLRRQRASLIADLRRDGWTLQRIADSVGRTKQTIDQWTKG